ncbi:MAG: hormogonium polysaccharide biosynthesis protein HpsL [Coleofasciculus sp. B1-GNL1-01]|uniref:hormogonium polysaccharide biosynthesis protein HpsL n=1 Tax=Coleofasciculus sp. B1-GNL1-01 TaxID=3068484 RepID=UPI0032FB9055
MVKSKSKSKVKKSKTSKKGKKQSKQSEAPLLSLKEQLAQQRKAKKQRQELIQWLFMTLLPGIFLGAIASVVAEPKMGVIAGAIIPCFGLSYKYPRKALWLFLIYMPFSGTVVYTLGGSALLQLAKDGLYFPALIGLYQQCRREKKPFFVPQTLMSTLSICLGFSLLTLFFVNGLHLTGNASGQPFLQGILGLKIFLGYVPLIFCAQHLLKSKKELLFCSRLHLGLAIICCLLGLWQYMMLKQGVCKGTDHLSGVELFKASLEARCYIGGALLYSPSQNMIRLPGTFVSPWHWGWFLIGNSALTFAAAFSDSSFLWRIGGLAGMALVFVNAVICGQRIALALVPAITILLLILTGQITNLKRFLPIGVGLGLVIAIGLAMNPELVQERIDSFKSRAEASPPQAFIQEQFEWATYNTKGWLGNGLGRATNSTRTFGDVSLVETYYPKLIFEVGTIGTLAFLAFVTHLTFTTFKAKQSVRDKNLRSFGSSYWVFVLIISYNTYWYPLDTDPVAVYYWFFAGVILALPKIDRQELRKQKLVEQQDESDVQKNGKKKVSKPRIATPAAS